MVDYMLQGLVRKRSELAGEVERVHQRLRQLMLDLETLDGTLRIIAPDMVVEGVRPKVFRPPENWSGRGEMSRMVLSILRVARQPLTTREIAAQLVVERGVAADDKVLRVMTRRVACALRGKRDAGLVRSSAGPGFHLLWEIVRS